MEVEVEITPSFIELIKQYNELRSFSEGLAAVKKNDKWGYINTKGDLVIPCEYDGYPREFSEGLAPVDKNGKWGFINTKGEIVIPFEYDSADSFSEGLAAVKKNDKWGFINTKGDLVTPCEYDYTGKFSEGLAGVVKNYKYGFINTKGDLVIPCEYDGYPLEFSEGLAPAGKNGKDGFINTNGEIVIPFEYDLALGFSDGLAPVEKNDKWGFINTKGDLVIPCEYDGAGSFSEELASVFKDGKWRIINTNGEVEGTIDGDYEFVYDFSEGMACVSPSKHGKWGFINTKGELVIPCEYESWSYFSNGVALVELNNKYGYIDKYGNSTFSETDIALAKIEEERQKLEEERELMEFKRQQMEEEQRRRQGFEINVSINYKKGSDGAVDYSSVTSTHGHVFGEPEKYRRSLTNIDSKMLIVPEGKKWIFKGADCKGCWGYILVLESNGKYIDKRIFVSGSNHETYTFYGGQKLAVRIYNLWAASGGATFHFIEKAEYD